MISEPRFNLSKEVRVGSLTERIQPFPNKISVMYNCIWYHCVTVMRPYHNFIGYPLSTALLRMCFAFQNENNPIFPYATPSSAYIWICIRKIQFHAVASYFKRFFVFFSLYSPEEKIMEAGNIFVYYFPSNEDGNLFSIFSLFFSPSPFQKHQILQLEYITLNCK